MTDHYQWTFGFIKSVAVYRTVSVVGEAGGADPTITAKEENKVTQQQ